VKKSAQICVVVLVLFLTIVGHAQDEDDDVIKVKSNLVNIDVIVKDKKGKYISDLKAEDFVITENGLPQKSNSSMRLFQKTTPTSPVRLSLTACASRAAHNCAAQLRLARARLANHRLTNLKQVREGAIKYVREQVTDADAVAILSVTNNLRMLQSFTQDKAKLIARSRTSAPLRIPRVSKAKM
jgi:VWFA-related protein